MSRKEGFLRRYETYSPSDHITNVIKFLENPSIEVLGVYVSRHIESYRIIGLKIKDQETGIIVKKKDLIDVKDYLDGRTVAAQRVPTVIRSHLKMIRDEFAKEEAEVKKSKTKKSLRRL